MEKKLLILAALVDGARTVRGILSLFGPLTSSDRTTGAESLRQQQEGTHPCPYRTETGISAGLRALERDRLVRRVGNSGFWEITAFGTDYLVRMYRPAQFVAQGANRVLALARNAA